MARSIKPSMIDVARRAQVSLGTVSNVLNRPELVADGTRDRVLSAVRELGFVRNESARALRTGGSRTLAYVALDASNPFFTDVAKGIQEGADSAGLSVFLCDSGQDHRRQAAYLDLLEQQRVDAVLITPLDLDDPALTDLPRRGTPVVLVDRAGGVDHCSVTVDDVHGGELAAAHLLEMNHRRLGFVGGPPDLGQVADRRAGFRRLADTVGAAVTVLDTDALTVAEGRRAGERISGIPAGQRPTAVFCCNDLLALGFLQQMVAQGMRVPQDIAIVGYDDIDFAQAAAVPLTSVSQPRHELGRVAAAMALDEARRSADHQHRQVVLQPELMARASTRLTVARSAEASTGSPGRSPGQMSERRSAAS